MASTSSRGENSTSGDDSDPSDAPISEYEKLRFSRIAENNARLEALGISKAANSLLPIKRRAKLNSAEEDDEYRPGEADGVEDDDEEFLGNSTSVSRYTKKKKKKKKKKTTSVLSKRKVLSKKNLDKIDFLGEDEGDDDLNKAIALSLQDSVAGGSRTVSTKKMKNDEEAGSCKKKRPELMSKTQMTEDELVIYFYQFDEAGKGFITVRDLGKMARVHDFTWTEEELQDMICCFDMDKDGKLSLDEFRKIVTRCRMMKQF